MPYHPQAIFGREDDPQIMDYFGAINTFYLELVRLGIKLEDDVKVIGYSGTDKQSAEDFQQDIHEALKSFRELKAELCRGITVERTRMGI